MGDAGTEGAAGELAVAGLTPAQRAGAQGVIVAGATALERPRGCTGTMLQHGRSVPASSAGAGDLAIYGSGAPVEHVAVCLGGGVVLSHGSEAGPFKLALDYRPDLLSVRRCF